MGQLYEAATKPSNTQYLTKDDISSVINIIQEESGNSNNQLVLDKLKNYQLKGDYVNTQDLRNYITSENANKLVDDIKNKTVWCADGKCRIEDVTAFPGYIKDKKFSSYLNNDRCWKVDDNNRLRIETCDKGSLFSYDPFNKKLIHKKNNTDLCFSSEGNNVVDLGFKPCSDDPAQIFNYDGANFIYGGPSDISKNHLRSLIPSSVDFTPDSQLPSGTVRNVHRWNGIGDTRCMWLPIE